MSPALLLCLSGIPQSWRLRGGGLSPWDLRSTQILGLCGLGSGVGTLEFLWSLEARGSIFTEHLGLCTLQTFLVSSVSSEIPDVALMVGCDHQMYA